MTVAIVILALAIQFVDWSD